METPRLTAHPVRKRPGVRDPVRDPVRNIVRDPVRDLARDPVRDPVRNLVRDPVRDPYSNETLLRSGLQSDSRFSGHPASNFNMIDGSYSIFTIL